MLFSSCFFLMKNERKKLLFLFSELFCYPIKVLKTKVLQARTFVFLLPVGEDK